MSYHPQIDTSDGTYPRRHVSKTDALLAEILEEQKTQTRLLSVLAGIPIPFDATTTEAPGTGTPEDGDQ